MLFTVVAAVFIASTRLHLCHAAPSNSSPSRQTIDVADECVQPHFSSVILSGVPFKVMYHEPVKNAEFKVTIENETIFTGDGSLSSYTLVLNDSGHFEICASFVNSTTDECMCSPFCQVLTVIPAWLTILPLIVTLFLALTVRQVVISLVVGIWFTATLVVGYNPLSGGMITFSVYIVGALANTTNSIIFVFILMLGGFTGAVQKSGGLVTSFKCFSASPRIVCTLAVMMSFLLFFNEHALVMIVGNSFKTMMVLTGVSNAKFAFLLQAMAATMSSLVPVSGWVGPQLGAIQSAISMLNITDKPFVILVKTLPYRYLQLLIIACALMVSLLNRDFGPMLTSEKIATAKQRPSTHRVRDVTTSVQASSETNQQDTGSQTDPIGPLEPDPKSPQRWFNSAIPVLVLVLTALGGMVYSGFDEINKSQSTNIKLNLTAANVFASADVTSSLTWGTVTATVLLFIMVLAQRILSLSKLIKAWMEGMKTVLEPVIVILLSFAIGDATADLRTSDYISQILSEVNFHGEYIPALAAILSYILAYATTSAFGTMAILCPLMVPVAYKLTGDEDIIIHTTAAILSSSTLGHLISPISDITILAKETAGCSLNTHQKSSVPYFVILALLALVFGSLPVGAGWYPWYVGWFLMLGALASIFVLFSAGHDRHSISLFRRYCPCVYVAVDQVWRILNLKVRLLKLKKKVLLKLTCRRQSSSVASVISATNPMNTNIQSTTENNEHQEQSNSSV